MMHVVCLVVSKFVNSTLT